MITDDVAYNICNERRGAIDRNPSIDCPECGASHNYKDYWEPRYVENKDWNPAEMHWLCDGCLDEAQMEYDLYKKMHEHKTLGEWE